jgi:uncharacterized protein DUF6798
MDAAAASRATTAGVIAFLTLLGWFHFPGHTFLASDTQIYMPMLEHLRDPAILARDPIATRPHLSFTIYDEVVLAARAVTGLGFQAALVIEQLLFRALGLVGVFLIARSLDLSRVASLFVTAVFGLGATISGPAVLTIEYEPVPRGFAIPLLVFAIGLMARGRMLEAGAAASLAFLYHPPSTWPFWAVYFILTLWPAEPSRMRRHIVGLAPLAVAVLIMLVISRLQPGVGEPQHFFGTIDEAQEKLMRMRASYNWVSAWGPRFLRHYLFLTAVALVAWIRLRRMASPELQAYMLGLPLIGISSLAISYLLLERLKWMFIPQFQPARAILFVTALVIIGGSCAGIWAARRGNYIETMLWFVVVLAIPVQSRLPDLLSVSSDLIRRRIGVILVLAALATAAAIFENTRKRLAPWAYAAAGLLPFVLVPGYAKVVNYAELHSSELDQLAGWARTSTPTSSVFLFPDSDRDLAPGIFRARAARAVYVDWKSGGQLNFMKSLGEEWWSRWQDVMNGGLRPFEFYGARGIDYIVIKRSSALKSAVPLFENQYWAVYKTGS